MKDIKTGCSGFYNSHWKDIFYTAGLPQGKWFEFYAEQLDALELNVTFYQFPTLERLQGWYHKSPADFTFSVKAPRTITHYKKLNDCHEMLHDFYTVCREGLKDKLGCILFQFPPSFAYTTENLALVLKHMKPGFKNVVEFRHPAWWNREVYDTLQLNNIIFCSIDHPTLPCETVINNPTAYVRLHGSPQLFYSDYSAEQLIRLYYTLCHADKLKEAYVFFNNTAGTAGILNAQEFSRIADQSS